MGGFLRNLALLAILGAAVYFFAPDITRQVMSVYKGLWGIPLTIVIVVAAALPSKKSSRKRW